MDQAVEGRDWPRTVVSNLEGFQSSLQEADEEGKADYTTG